MPGGLGASYRSLADDVYKTTTIPDNKFNMMESVKKVFSFTVNQRRSEPLIEKEPQPVVTRKMPASAAAEETALLG
ncbi:Protein ndrg3 [Homalodisca vitripennis]|nr:Protein ndrg3 [Homalodisca vitripennis]